MAEVNYSAVNTEEAHHSTANNDSEEVYYSAVNTEELYYANAKELNKTEMRKNDTYEMPPQHSNQHGGKSRICSWQTWNCYLGGYW